MRHPDGNILIVSHKALLRILLCQLFDTELSHYRLGPSWPVGGVTQIDFDASGPALRRLADVAHLAALDRGDKWTAPLRAASA